MYTIAIQPDKQKLTSGRTQSASERWTEQLQKAGHRVRAVDVLQPNIREQLQECDGFMWWFAHLPFPRNLGKRLLPAIEHGLRMPVFPSWETIWHFDDKVAQGYLLEAAGLPTPKNRVFWSPEHALEFCRTAQYPLVLKLASGITSENVRLLHNAAEAAYWIKRMFNSGAVDLKVPALQNTRGALVRMRDAANLLLTGTPPKMGRRTDLQKGYLLLQEFLPRNEYDTRIAVIGNRAFGFRRFNRPNDFRASGSGMRDNTPEKIDLEIVRLAFRVAQTLNTQSVAIDGMFRGEERVLIEISYYYEAWILYECPGHWELNGDAATGELFWVDGQMLPEDAILEDFLVKIGNNATDIKA